VFPELVVFSSLNPKFGWFWLEEGTPTPPPSVLTQLALVFAPPIPLLVWIKLLDKAWLFGTVMSEFEKFPEFSYLVYLGVSCMGAPPGITGGPKIEF
jgi:hypothetical protein